MEMPSSTGSPTAFKTMTGETNPTAGVAADPIDTSVAVMIIIKNWPISKSIFKTYATKIGIVVKSNADPSIFKTAPIEQTNLAIGGDILFLFSTQSIVTGKVAADEDVPNATK